MGKATLLSLMQKGGAVMWPLFALFLATLVILVERIITYAILTRKKEKRPSRKLEKPLDLLDLIALVSPILGFLGTVTGMIRSFQAISEAAVVQLQVVAAGLYEALFTTAFGLIISIIATISSHVLDLWAENLCEKEETKA
jgi:biopolymer transport protein ExbB/TolQ